MHTTIKKLILWPKDPRHPYRTLEFVPDKINLITGRSRTGKSAITYIIDYVLGSDKCAIPIGEIRETVAWYGLLLDLGFTQLLVAREEPGTRVESSNYFVDERPVVEVPIRPEKNTNRDSFKDHMNTLAGLPTLDLDPSAGAASLGRPSFRDMAAFNYLPQHIVANPYTLFYKTDTTEHRQKLRTVFPLVLGAISSADLVAEHEKAEAERQLRRLQAQMERRLQAADAWRAEAFGLHARAIELGLLPASAERPSSLIACMSDLAKVPAAVGPDRDLPARAPGATLAATKRLEEIRGFERRADRQLLEFRTRLQRIRTLRAAVEEYGDVTAQQGSRVHGVGWLQAKLGEAGPCPLCSSTSTAARDRLMHLAEAATELGERQRAAVQVPVALEREEQEHLAKLKALEEEVRDLRTERSELEKFREKAGGQSLDEVYRFVGRIEQAIKNVQQTEDGGVLEAELRGLEKRLQELGAVLDPQARQRKLAAALDVVSREIAYFAMVLGLARHDDAIRLNVGELTLVFVAQGQGRHDYLWEIGSGANWMGYHLATLLSLHRWFLSAGRSPVPSFLVVDQPSQVYFPTGIIPQADEKKVPAVAHEIKETRRIFALLAEGLSRTKHQLQVIVTEHADEQTLGSMPFTHTVADWHGDPTEVDYLIPRLWLK